MRHIINSIFALLVAALAITACEQDRTEDGDTPSGQTTVSVPLTITIDDMEYGTEENRSRATRSESAADNDGISSKVKNLWIAEMSGTDDESIVLAVHYVSDMTTIGSLKFIETVKATRMVYLANTGVSDEDFITRGMKLSVIKAKEFNLTATATEGQIYAENLLYVDGENKYFKMSGSEVLSGGLRATTSLTASLKRSAVKITVNIKNKWVDSAVTSIQLYSAADRIGYFLNREDFDLSAIYPATITTPLDLPVKTLSVEGNIDATEAQQSISFYIPANMRGVAEGSTAETKPENAPDGSTYIVIGADEADDGWKYNYTFYLGVNLTDDYNLKPNYHYTYDITFTSMGNAYDDPRIEIDMPRVEVGDLVVGGLETDGNSEYEGDEMGGSSPSFGNEYESDGDDVTINSAE